MMSFSANNSRRLRNEQNHLERLKTTELKAMEKDFMEDGRIYSPEKRIASIEFQRYDNSTYFRKYNS